MRWILSTLLVLSACASSKSRRVASEVVATPLPSGSYLFETAVKAAPSEVWSFLQAPGASAPFDCQQASRVRSCLPADFRREMRTARPAPEVNRELQSFLRGFRKLSAAKRKERAQHLAGDFQCSKAAESYAMALMLEVDFPDLTAFESALTLHRKLQDCVADFSRESLIRLAVFEMSQDRCDRAEPLLQKAEAVDPQGPKDRIRYLQQKCRSMAASAVAATSKGPAPAASAGSPWNAYFAPGGREFESFLNSQPQWHLSARSGFENWDRYLQTLVQAQRIAAETGDDSLFRALTRDLEMDSLRDLPRPFQTSMLTLLHIGGDDLRVFRLLHPILSADPGLANFEILQVLFPKRHWDTILEISQMADPLLIKSVIRQESAFNPQARSRAGAMGLMQLIYPTARRFGVTSRQSLLTPQANVRAGARYLSGLIDDFGSIELALAAYNAGPDHVREWKKRYQTADPDLFVEMIPFKETREYVRLVMRNYRVYKALLSEPRGADKIAGTVNH